MMISERSYPQLLQVVIDTPEVRRLAEFYRQLLGLRYRPGDEPVTPGEARSDEKDWLVLRDDHGVSRVAFQQVARLSESTWPDDGVPQQMHLDLTVTSTDELEEQHLRSLDLGARLLLDRSDDAEEPLRVYADPSGHPFCIFVVPASD